MQRQFSFTYRDKLNDEEWVVAMQEELRVKIEWLKKEKARLQQIIIIMKGDKNG
jgi:predicted nucleic-acid-binding protein